MNNGTIVSTRIRLARNIGGLPFPHKLGEIPSRKIAESVGESLRGADKFVRYDIADVPALDGTILQEKHLISPDLTVRSARSLSVRTRTCPSWSTRRTIYASR